MFETILAILLCAAALGMAGLIIYLTYKGVDKRVASVREGEMVTELKKSLKKSKKRRR